MEQNLIIPSEIPWEDIKGKDLEELLYWLFNSMGAKELEWRIGGKGQGAADQGRDLELAFFQSSPDGNLAKQKWWIEAKGRKGTVESLEVKEAVINAAGKSNIDVVVIATNTNFSNPTRDWVKGWQNNNPRPVIRLWERTELEDLCSKNPLAVIRLYSKALSNQGTLDVAKTKFWDYASFTDEPTLKKLWKVKSELDFTPYALFALISSEVANGDVNERSWGAYIDEKILVESLVNGLINLMYLAARGVRQYPIIKSLAYLILVATKRFGVGSISNLLTMAWAGEGGKEFPEQIRKIILRPVIGVLNQELADVCSSNCRRMLTDPFELTEREVEEYWNRLTLKDIEEVDGEIVHALTITNTKEPCVVGFPVNKDTECPLYDTEEPEENIGSFLEIVNEVMTFRSNES